MLRDLPHPDPGSADLRSPNRLLIWVGRNQLGMLSIAITFGVIWMVAQAMIPGALGAGIQAVTDKNEAAVLRWSAVVLALGILQAAAGIMRHRMAVTNWITAASRIQQLLVRQSARLGGDLPKQVSTGEVVAASANDVERIGSAFDVIARFIGAIVAFFVVAFVLLALSRELGMIVLIGVPLLSLMVAPLVRPLERRERDQRARLGEATALAADTVAGLRVLRGIGGEELFLERYNAASTAVQVAAVRTARVRSLLDAMQVGLPGIFVVVITWLGALQALNGDMTVGQLVAFYGYTAFLVLPLRTITEGAQRFASARVAATRVINVLRLERLLPDAKTPAPEPPIGSLVDDTAGLEIEPGLFTAIVVDDHDTADQLASRLGRYEGGHVTLGGVALADLSRETTRRRILVQDKDPMILSGAAEDLFDIPRTERVGVPDALDWANAVDVIEALPEGLATELPERGRSLSGGQRQRLALARSYVADPDILVLDEPTSAVDAHTEARIGARIREARPGRTTVVFTTSPLVLEHADKVVLVIDGRAVASGTHRELQRDNVDYRHVVGRGGEL